MAYQFDILTCAPANVTLRSAQTAALLWFQENYAESQALVLSMPPGDGKSIVAMAACEWMKRNGLGNSATITPTKILQDQYAKDFDWLPMLKGMSNYNCHATPAGNCKSTKTIFTKCCGPQCPYLLVRTACQTAPVSLYNFSSYYHNDMQKHNVIIDEAHGAANFLFEMFSVKLWQPEWKFDKDIDPTIENVLGIINTALLSLGEHRDIALSKKIETLIDELDKEILRYKSVRDTLIKFGQDVLIVKKIDEYHGKVTKSAKGTKQIFIQIKPLRVANLAESILWPAEATAKIVLMSATIGPKDVEELGLSGKKVAYFESKGSIPKDRRPFVVIPVAKMSYANQAESIPIIADYIKKLAARHPNEKGLVHCTYGVSVKLQKLLEREARFVFHDKYNKNDRYLEFRNKPGNQILVASGMAEGVDLPDDCARWQVISKVQWPSLADDVASWRAHNAPDLYKWETIRCIIQQSGRIVRSQSDFGTTYMLDSDFRRLWNEARHLFPKWFRDSVIFVST